MTLTSLCPETQIRNRLRKLGISENEFCLLNPAVGRTRFFQAMRGEVGKHFTARQVERILDAIGELESLQEKVGLPIRWSETESVQIAITLRRVQQIALELFDDHRFDEQAERATEAVPKQ